MSIHRIPRSPATNSAFQIPVNPPQAPVKQPQVPANPPQAPVQAPQTAEEKLEVTMTYVYEVVLFNFKCFE